MYFNTLPIYIYSFIIDSLMVYICLVAVFEYDLVFILEIRLELILGNKYHVD